MLLFQPNTKEKWIEMSHLEWIVYWYWIGHNKIKTKNQKWFYIVSLIKINWIERKTWSYELFAKYFYLEVLIKWCFDEYYKSTSIMINYRNFLSHFANRIFSNCNKRILRILYAYNCSCKTPCRLCTWQVDLLSFPIL